MALGSVKQLSEKERKDLLELKEIFNPPKKGYKVIKLFVINKKLKVEYDKEV